MATRRRGGSRNRQQRQSSGNGGDSLRVQVGAGWINPDEVKEEVYAALDGARLRIALGEGVVLSTPEGDFDAEDVGLMVFRNDNDKGSGPHVNLVGYIDQD